MSFDDFLGKSLRAFRMGRLQISLYVLKLGCCNRQETQIARVLSCRRVITLLDSFVDWGVLQVNC